MKKRRKFILMIILVLAGAILLINCNFVEPVQYRYAKKLLKEKYNEEFEVLDTWGNGGKSYYALCYPVRDRSLLFEGNFALDHSDFRDEYDKAIFSNEVKKMVQPKLRDIFQECYVYPSVISRESGITDKTDITIESFIKATESPGVLLIVAVNNDKYLQDDYSEEYKKIITCMDEMSDINISPTLALYFLPEERYKQYVDYFKNNIKMQGEFSNIVSGYPDFGFGYKDEKPNESEAEYVKLRKEQ